MTFTSRELSWLAGLMEGEGSFQWKRNNRRGTQYPVVQLTMTDEDVVKRARQIAGVGTLHGPYDNGPGRKPRYMWCVQKKVDSVGLMMTLYPMMGLRRQARIREILLEWRST